MTYTGHKLTTFQDGQTPVDWVANITNVEARHYGIEPPTTEQIALVMSALRMHTILTYAAGYDFSELSKPDEVTTFHPVESSIGRFFRDASREVLDEVKR